MAEEQNGGTFMTVADVARRLQLAQKSVYRLVARDLLSCHKTRSGTLRFEECHLQNFLSGEGKQGT